MAAVEIPSRNLSNRGSGGKIRPLCMSDLRSHGAGCEGIVVECVARPGESQRHSEQHLQGTDHDGAALSTSRLGMEIFSAKM
jgi:hypothetical protein